MHGGSRKIYRDGSQDPGTAGGFWTPDPGYASYCKSGVTTFWEAIVGPDARVVKLPGSPSNDVIREHAGIADVLEFEAWDWPTTELVVLDPGVLDGVKKVERPCGVDGRVV